MADPEKLNNPENNAQETPEQRRFQQELDGVAKQMVIQCAEVQQPVAEEPVKRSPKFEELKGLIAQEAKEEGVELNVMASLFGSAVTETINSAFTKKYGFPFSEEELPKVIVGKLPGESGYTRSAVFNLQNGEKIDQEAILIEDVDKVLSGNIMSEELAHFYREHLGPGGSNKEEIPAEFFGFLGRRLFGKAAKEGNAALTDLEDNERGINSKKDFTNMIRTLGKKVVQDKMAIKEMGEGVDNPVVIRGVQEGVAAMDATFKEIKKSMRKDITHQRGYEWASKVDLNKITDWKKLFSLPNDEVRKRFFTDRSDYSGL
jgi:hypothetical protein